LPRAFFFLGDGWMVVPGRMAVGGDRCRTVSGRD